MRLDSAWNNQFQQTCCYYVPPPLLFSHPKQRRTYCVSVPDRSENGKYTVVHQCYANESKRGNNVEIKKWKHAKLKFAYFL